MRDTIDMRVVLIGAVALVVALHEGAGDRVPPALTTARPDLVRCGPAVAGADVAAAARFAEAIGDITGSVVPAANRAPAACR